MKLRWKRNLPMAVKIALACSLLSLLTLAIGGFLSHQGLQSSSIEPLLGKRIDFIARNVALQLSGVDFDVDFTELQTLERNSIPDGGPLTGTIRESHQAKRIHKTLTTARRQNALDSEIEIYIKNPDKPAQISLLISSNTEAQVNKSHPIDSFFEQVLKDARPLHTGLYRRNGSQWISSLSPIENEKGDLIGILRIDYCADDEIKAATFGVLKSIAIAGLFAFLISLGLAYIVSRLLSRPIRYLSQAAMEIGKGNLIAQLDVSNQDEIGDLAKALQAMHNEICANREKLENYSRNLEQTVAWRTSELRETKETISAMIDSLDEGFFMFGRDGICLPYFSHACIDLLEQDPVGKPVETLLKLETGSLKEWLDMAFSDQIPFDGIADLAPKSCKHSGGKHIKISFHLIRDQDGKISHIVGVAQDITAMVLAEKAAESERDFSKLVIAIIENRDRFSDFILDSETELSNALGNIHADIQANIVSISPESRASIMRAFHTLKGCAGLFHLTEIHHHAHEAESELIGNESETPEELARLLLKMRTVLVDNVTKYSRFIGFNPFSSDRLISVREKDILKLRESLRAMSASNMPNEFLLPAFDRFLLHQSIDQAFSHYNLVVKQAAEKLDKNVSDVQFINGELKLYHGPFRTLFGTCIHAFRNAVDHGLETPAERLAAGKAEAGSIIVVFNRTGEFGDLSIEIRDDGRGINEEIVRNKLRKANPDHPLVNAKYDELIQILFESGFSTKTKVTELSGRGVGLDAIRFEAQRLGGTAWLSSVLGQGSTIHIRVPLSMDRRSQKLAA